MTYVPNAQQLTDASGTIQNPEVAEYFLNRTQIILQKAKLTDKCQDTIKSIENLVQFMNYKYNQSKQPWNAEKPLAAFPNTCENMAMDAVKQLPDNDELIVRYGVTPEGEFGRSYSCPADQINLHDQLLNAWFGKIGVVSEVIEEHGVKNTVLFQANPETGEKTRYNDGSLVRVDPDWLEDQMNDPQQGFQAYLQRLQEILGKIPTEVVTFRQQMTAETKPVAMSDITREDYDAVVKVIDEALAKQEALEANKAEPVAPEMEEEERETFRGSRT